MADNKIVDPEALSRLVFYLTVAGAAAFIAAVGVLVW